MNLGVRRSAKPVLRLVKFTTRIAASSQLKCLESEPNLHFKLKIWHELGIGFTKNRNLFVIKQKKEWRRRERTRPETVHYGRLHVYSVFTFTLTHTHGQVLVRESS